MKFNWLYLFVCFAWGLELQVMILAELGIFFVTDLAYQPIRRKLLAESKGFL